MGARIQGAYRMMGAQDWATRSGSSPRGSGIRDRLRPQSGCYRLRPRRRASASDMPRLQRCQRPTQRRLEYDGTQHPDLDVKTWSPSGARIDLYVHREPGYHYSRRATCKFGSDARSGNSGEWRTITLGKDTQLHARRTFALPPVSRCSDNISRPYRQVKIQVQRR